MGTENHEGTTEQFIGVSKSEARDRLVSEDDTRDAQTVSAVLEHVTEDDVVTREAIEQTVTDTAMILSTAETRVELAELALEDATEAADSVPDVDAVRARRSAFESVVSDAGTHVKSLGETMQTLSGWQRTSYSLYELVMELREIASTAQHVTQVADDTQLDLEEFQTWLGNHASRVRELNGDVEILVQLLDDISGTASELADAEEASGNAWFDASLQHRMVPLLIADVRAELADLRVLAPESASGDDLADIEDSIDSLEARTEDVESMLARAARDAWEDRYADRLDSFEETLASFETPVSWARVQSERERVRQA